VVLALAGVGAIVLLVSCGGLGVWVALKGRLPTADGLPSLVSRDPTSLEDAKARIEAATDRYLKVGILAEPEPQLGRPVGVIFADPNRIGLPLPWKDKCGAVIECADEVDAREVVRRLAPSGPDRWVGRAGRFIISINAPATWPPVEQVRREFGL
jgi:hypothetical protein